MAGVGGKGLVCPPTKILNILMQNPAFGAIFLLIWTNSIFEFQLVKLVLATPSV